jgi:hypothetical protein
MFIVDSHKASNGPPEGEHVRGGHTDCALADVSY